MKETFTILPDGYSAEYTVTPNTLISIQATQIVIVQAIHEYGSACGTLGTTPNSNKPMVFIAAGDVIRIKNSSKNESAMVTIWN